MLGPTCPLPLSSSQPPPGCYQVPSCLRACVPAVFLYLQDCAPRSSPSCQLPPSQGQGPCGLPQTERGFLSFHPSRPHPLLLLHPITTSSCVSRIQPGVKLHIPLLFLCSLMIENCQTDDNESLRNPEHLWRVCLSVFPVWLSLHDQIQVKHFAQEDLTWGELNTGDAMFSLHPFRRWAHRFSWAPLRGLLIWSLSWGVSASLAVVQVYVSFISNLQGKAFLNALRCLYSIYSGYDKILLFLIMNYWFPWSGPCSWSMLISYGNLPGGACCLRSSTEQMPPFIKAPTVCRAWRAHEGSTAPLSRWE